MHCDPAAARAMSTAPRRARRAPWAALLEQVLALSAGHGELVRHAERSWASATFAGSRHTFVFDFRGGEAVAAGEQLIAALPEHEFALPRALVADATIRAASHELLPEPRLTVEAELLVLDED